MQFLHSSVSILSMQNWLPIIWSQSVDNTHVWINSFFNFPVRQILSISEIFIILKYFILHMTCHFWNSFVRMSQLLRQKLEFLSNPSRQIIIKLTSMKGTCLTCYIVIYLPHSLSFLYFPGDEWNLGAISKCHALTGLWFFSRKHSNLPAET